MFGCDEGRAPRTWIELVASCSIWNGDLTIVQIDTSVRWTFHSCIFFFLYGVLGLASKMEDMIRALLGLWAMRLRLIMTDEFPSKLLALQRIGFRWGCMNQESKYNFT